MELNKDLLEIIRCYLAESCDYNTIIFSTALLDKNVDKELCSSEYSADWVKEYPSYYVRKKLNF